MSVHKIIIIGPAFPYRGGPARFNENFCRALIEQNIDTEIISFTLQYPSLLFPGTSQFEHSNTSAPPLKITHLINTINPLSWIKTARYINAQKPDAVIFRYWLPFFAPAFGTIARLLNKSIKVLALTDNIIPHEKRIGDSSLTSYFIKACHGFLTMSQKVLDDLSKFTNTPNKLLVHHPLYENYPPAIDKHKARELLNLPQEERILLFFGLIRSYKGLDMLLDAMNELQHGSFKLLIAGEFYDDKQRYLEMINQYHLEEKILVHDYFIPDTEVNIYFSACDAVIQPYKSATNSGVSMVSYFYNKPIISTNVGGLKEIIRHNETGWLCEPHPHSIAQTIQHFLALKDLSIFEKNIQNFKKEFSWQKFVQSTIHLIDKIQVR